MKVEVAVILTCHNRKAKTEACLDKLFAQNLPKEIGIEVFLCDDGSVDGTSKMVHEKFPLVNVIVGDGNLYWGGGMRMAWNFAMEHKKFDFYMWINDDTFLIHDALIKFFQDFYSLPKSLSILIGSCMDPTTSIFSFGGSNDQGPIVPNGELQKAKWINGNLVLIPSAVVDKLGILSSKYTHFFGDYDYGFRAQKIGIDCYVSREYLAISEQNQLPFWGNSEFPLKKRLALLHSIKGQAIKEYTYFLSQHFGKRQAVKNLISSYSRALFPKFFLKIRGLVQNH